MAITCHVCLNDASIYGCRAGCCAYASKLTKAGEFLPKTVKVIDRRSDYPIVSNNITCSICRGPTDTFLRGTANNGTSTMKIVVCSGCVDHMRKDLDAKYKAKPAIEVEECAWQTATDDSDP